MAVRFYEVEVGDSFYDENNDLYQKTDHMRAVMLHSQEPVKLEFNDLDEVTLPDPE